jgi:hypothetical protein
MKKNSDTVYLPEIIWGLEIAQRNGWYGFVDFRLPNNYEVQTVVFHPSDIEAKIKYLKENYNNDGRSKHGVAHIVNSGSIYNFEHRKRYHP